MYWSIIGILIQLEVTWLRTRSLVTFTRLAQAYIFYANDTVKNVIVNILIATNYYALHCIEPSLSLEQFLTAVFSIDCEN